MVTTRVEYNVATGSRPGIDAGRWLTQAELEERVCPGTITNVLMDDEEHRVIQFGKPDTTFGNVTADVIADKQTKCTRENFCSVMRSVRRLGV